MKVQTLIRALMVAMAVALVGLASAAHAARISAPARDWKGVYDYNVYPSGSGIPTSSTWVTVWGSPYQAPTWGAPATIYPAPQGMSPMPPWGFVVNTFNDIIIIGSPGSLNPIDSTNRAGAAAAYVTYEETGFPTGSALFTTIYGVDLVPGSPDALSIAGFDTSVGFPELSNEQITGPSGTVYHASSGSLVTVGSLGGVLGAGADLSIFGGNPSNSVWVFQTTLPLGEFTVPEIDPSGIGSVLALVTGALGLLERRRMYGTKSTVARRT